MQQMWEMRVWSLGPEDPLQEEMAAHWVFLPRESHGQRGQKSYSPWGCKESDMPKATERTDEAAAKVF